MELFFVILLFSAMFAIYEMVRRTNNNVLEQAAEIKKLREDLAQFNESNTH